jgi:RND family efflux transporter MFP subunit
MCAALAACANGGAAPPSIGSAPPPGKRSDAGAPDAGAPSKGYIGVIAASQMLDVSPLAAGRIETVNVRDGDEVKAGDVVAEMDPTSLQEELRAAEAAYSAAQAAETKAAVDVREAQRKLNVEQEAFKKGISPRQAVDDAASTLARARAQAGEASADARQAQSRVQTARDHVGNTKLTATFDGVVQHRYAEPGTTVQPGQTIVRILGRNDLRLKFAIPPERAKTLAPDTKVTATVDTVTAPVPAVVRQVTPAVDTASGMIFVEATLTADPAVLDQLRPGLAAWVPLP